MALIRQNATKASAEAEQDVGLEEPAGGEGSGEDEDVLDPLARPHRPDRGREARAARLLEQVLLRDGGHRGRGPEVRGGGRRRLEARGGGGRVGGSRPRGRGPGRGVGHQNSDGIGVRRQRPARRPRGYPLGVRTPRVLRGVAVAVVLGFALTGCASGSVPEPPASSSPAPTPTVSAPVGRREPGGTRLRERSCRPGVRPGRRPAERAGRPAEQRHRRPRRPVRGGPGWRSTGVRRSATASPSPPTTRRRPR